ncbi:thyroid hormone-induced protein B-like [Actinia tenebrosa]|uniref:Thyroid hormone-induced protein B-like n=1 Tax=Actinia tenebrosa TaxID=6105 RepID=A0A6P8J256_ACTTE|nr:thyroid hormone-induced protein B-like [Actinia tenebrosa]
MKLKMLGYHRQLMLFLVAITARFCTGFDFECNFDSDACGFQQVRSWGNTGLNGDHKDWTRAKSSEPVRYSGPARDHTSGSGYYMVFDVWAFRSFGARAIIYKQITVTKSNTWISFWYHMFGFSGMGGLSVYAGNTAIFAKNDNQGNGWKKAEIKLDVLGSVKVRYYLNCVGNLF